MDRNNIKNEKNEGIRTLAKLCLNNLWVKFGEKLDEGETVFIDNPADLYKIINNDDLKNINYIRYNDDIYQFHYKCQDKYTQKDNTTIIFIAIFTTSNARIKLYSGLDFLGWQVCYYDTDSTIYIISDDEEDINTSDTLGDFKDELLCDYGEGVYITEFVSDRPKNYAYRMNNWKIVEKIKGVNLNHENRKKLNFDVVKKFLLDNVNGIERNAITTVQNQFVKNLNDKTIYIKEINKNYNFISINQKYHT